MNSDFDKAERIAEARKTAARSAVKRRAERAAALERFRAELVRRLGGTPDAIQDALITSACALYAVILRRSTLTRGVNRKVNPMQVSAAVSGLKSTLLQLGVLEGKAEADKPASDLGRIMERIGNK